MKIPSYKRINIEDFSDEEQQLVQKLASTLNISIDTLYSGLNNRLNFKDNFDSTQKTFNIQVDTNGNPISPTGFKLNTINNTIPRAVGSLVINALNTTNSDVYPTGGIFISFTQNQDVITINNITGLPSGYVFQITVIIFNS